MLDQSFTAENFRKIFDLENRKGVYLEGKFFPEIEKITQDIKKNTTHIRNLHRKKGSMSDVDYQKQLTPLNEQRKSLKEQKEKLLKEELEKISTKIRNGSFKFSLKEKTPPSGKAVYVTEDDPCAFFTIKQIQHNIKKLYKVKQRNRHEIIKQLITLLDDKFPKYVIRTDIQSFYESIDRASLLKQLNEDPLLTLSSKQVIKNVLKEYQNLSGSPIGLPRGIGFSAYLAELYMRRFDRKIAAHPDVIYYARYVDDIVVIFTPKPISNPKTYLPYLESQAQELNLQLNKTKTSEHDTTQATTENFTYLGYNISFGSSQPIKIAISGDKKDKIKKRVNLSFDAYHKQAKFNEKKARKLLIKRIQFLTSNTRLHNNKGKILIGIYYSNSLISDSSSLQPLEDCLTTQIAKLPSGKLQSKLQNYSIIDGFERQRFQSFKIRELSEIVELWKNGT